MHRSPFPLTLSDDYPLSGEGDDKLPAGYKRCEFLNFNHSSIYDQRIETQIPWGNVARIELGVQPVGLSASNNKNFMLCATGRGLDPFVWLKTSDNLYSYSSLKGTSSLDSELNENAKNDLKIDITECSKPEALLSFGSWIDINYTRCAYWYYAQFYSSENKSLGRFTPCLDPTGTPCMYDTVSRKTFYNQGTGDFLYKLKVPEARKLPEGYYPLEYLESTGTQYIDTGITVDGSSVLNCTAEFNQPLQLDYWLYGIAFKQFAFLPKFRDAKAYAYWKETPTSIGVLQNNVIYNIKQSRKEFKINESVYTLNDTAELSTTNSMRLWTIPNIGAKEHNAIAKIYSFSISRAGELQLDFQPCLDDQGRPCMYDFVSKQPFYNQGTGDDFVYEVPEALATLPMTLSLRDEKPVFAKLTENGIRRLYRPANTTYFLYPQLMMYAYENGYKELVESEMPTEGYWVPQWRETDSQIICDWIETEAPEMEI